MTRQEELEIRKRCPYDAMGDYSLLSTKTEEEKKNFNQSRSMSKK